MRGREWPEAAAGPGRPPEAREASSCSSDSAPSLGTSMCHRCGPKNTRKKKKKKKKRKKKNKERKKKQSKCKTKDSHQNTREQNKRGREEKVTYTNKSKTTNKMAIRTYILITPLKVNGLKFPTKRPGLAEWIRKQDTLPWVF